MLPLFAAVLQEHAGDVEERRSLLVPLIREHFMGHDYSNDEKEAESLLTLWLEGIEGGMESVLVLVVLQTVSDRRGAQWEELVLSESLDALLQNLTSAQVDSTVFLRIFLFCLMRLAWRARRHWTEAAQAIGPYPDSTIAARSGEGEWVLVRKTLLLVGRARRVACRRQLLTFVHQLFLENGSLIKRFYKERCLSEELCTWAVEMIPSLYILIDQVLEDVRKASSYDSWLLFLGVHLALKYPMSRTLELCTFILEHCRQHGDTLLGSSLRVTVLALEAFPILMETAMELLTLWRQRHAESADYRMVSQEVAQQIVAINERVRQPIYHRSIVLNIE